MYSCAPAECPVSEKCNYWGKAAFLLFQEKGNLYDLYHLLLQKTDNVNVSVMAYDYSYLLHDTGTIVFVFVC